MFESNFLTSLVGFFIVLTPLVFIHELGHYFAAIRSGVKVESFSIGILSMPWHAIFSFGTVSMSPSSCPLAWLMRACGRLRRLLGTD